MLAVFCVLMQLVCQSNIALVKALFFSSKSIDIFLISPGKHMLWVLIRSAHNICFPGEIRKIFTGYPLYLDLCQTSDITQTLNPQSAKFKHKRLKFYTIFLFLFFPKNTWLSYSHEFSSSTKVNFKIRR